MPLVYDELRRLARSYLCRQRQNHTLQATALVNEAYLRLIGQNSVSLQNRAQFFGLAATMMRNILVDHKTTYVSSFYIAIVYAGLGDKEEAIKWLKTAHDKKSDYLVYLNVMPLLDDLREEPAFRELVRLVELSQ